MQESLRSALVFCRVPLSSAGGSALTSGDLLRRTQMGALNGVLMRGAFQGVATDAYGSEIHVAYEAVDREGQITERVERIQFRAFNPATGVASEVAKSLVDLPIGTRIAIKLFTDIKPAGIKKDGRPYKPFATYAALALEIEE